MSEKVMRTFCVAAAGMMMVVAAGCGNDVKPTGYLSDYSKLEPSEGNALRYVGPRLGDYNKFIVEPVRVYLHEDVKPDAVPDPKVKGDLATYFRNAIIEALSPRYLIVSRPARGVARIRVAITNIDKSTPALNILPPSKLIGLGLGGAAMEAEVLDSMSGQQIAAAIQSRKGSRFSLAGTTSLGDAKAVIDGWTQRFRKTLDRAHGVTD